MGRRNLWVPHGRYKTRDPHVFSRPIPETGVSRVPGYSPVPHTNSFVRPNRRVGRGSVTLLDLSPLPGLRSDRVSDVHPVRSDHGLWSSHPTLHLRRRGVVSDRSVQTSTRSGYGEVLSTSPHVPGPPPESPTGRPRGTGSPCSLRVVAVAAPDAGPLVPDPETPREVERTSDLRPYPRPPGTRTPSGTAFMSVETCRERDGPELRGPPYRVPVRLPPVLQQIPSIPPTGRAECSNDDVRSDRRVDTRVVSV